MNPYVANQCRIRCGRWPWRRFASSHWTRNICGWSFRLIPLFPFFRNIKWCRCEGYGLFKRLILHLCDINCRVSYHQRSIKRARSFVLVENLSFVDRCLVEHECKPCSGIYGFVITLVASKLELIYPCYILSMKSIELCTSCRTRTE